MGAKKSKSVCCAQKWDTKSQKRRQIGPRKWENGQEIRHFGQEIQLKRG